MKALLPYCVVKVTTMVLCLADAWLWPQIALAHRIETIREWGRLKLENNTHED